MLDSALFWFLAALCFALPLFFYFSWHYSRPLTILTWRSALRRGWRFLYSSKIGDWEVQSFAHPDSDLAGFLPPMPQHCKQTIQQNATFSSAFSACKSPYGWKVSRLLPSPQFVERLRSQQPPGLLHLEDGLVVFESRSSGTGGSIWTPTFVLCNFLDGREPFGADFLRNTTVLELGAGVGLLGVVASLLDPHMVFVTEIKRLSPMVNLNAHLNLHPRILSKVQTLPLTWGDKELPAGLKASITDSKSLLLLGCDLLYNPELYDDLFRTIDDVCACASAIGANAQVLLCYEVRNEVAEKQFFQRFSKYEVQEVPIDFEVSKAVKLHRLRRAPASKKSKRKK